MSKMKWFRVFLAAAVFSSACLFLFNVSAATAPDRAQKIVTTANAKIESEVETAQAVCGTLERVGFSSGSLPVQMEVAILQKETSLTVTQAEQKLDRLGVSYQCTYETVYVGGNPVEIDPFLCVA